MIEIKSEMPQEDMRKEEELTDPVDNENEKPKAEGTFYKEEAEESRNTEETEKASSIEETEEASNIEELDESNRKEQTENEKGTGGKIPHKKSGRKKRDKKEEKIEELTDRLMRNMAEFENFRKRSEKEKSTMFEMGTKSVVEKILPIVDNLERGFGALSEEEREEPFTKGIEQIYKQFLDTLEGIGVKPIIAVGEEFDPELHNAVMHDEDENLGENTVSQELQKGYMYKDSVVRHSMVKVSN